MRGLSCLWLCSLLLCTLSVWAREGRAERPSAAATPQENAPAGPAKPTKGEVLDFAKHGAMLSTALAGVLSVSISPLLGVTVLGAYGYFAADSEERDHLPWYNSPFFWVPCALILLLVFFKDTLGPLAPPMKKLLDAAEVFENKLSALVAAPAILSSVIGQYGEALGLSTAQALGALDPVAYAAEGGAQGAGFFTQAAYYVGSFEISVVGGIIFAVSWLASHTISVLILINPIPFLDVALKAFRLGVIGILLLSAKIHPLLGLLVSLLYIYLAYRLAGWSLRLLVFGSVFAWDILTFRSWRFRPVAEDTWAFSSTGLPSIPARSYGRLFKNTQGQLELRYRPWLVFPVRTVVLPGETTKYAVGSGLIHPCLVDAGEDESDFQIYVRFPPRYKRHEAELTGFFGLAATRDVSFRRSVRLAWRWLKRQYRALRGKPATEG